MLSLTVPRRTLAVWRSQSALNRAIMTAYAVAFVLFVTGQVLTPSFLVPEHLGLLLLIASFLGLLAIGQTFVILSGGIDLSIPYVLDAGAVFMTGLLATYPGADVPVILAVLLGGAAIGALNGVGIAYLNIPPLVMTLCMNTLMTGVVLVYTHGMAAGNPSPIILAISNGSVGPIPFQVILWAILGGLAEVVLLRTGFGRRVYAVGNSITASHLSGVNVARTLIGVYAISGLFAALTGMLLAGFASHAYLGMGDPYLLSTIAAVVVGGGSILGGRGRYAGTLAGVLVLTVLTTILSIANMPTAVQDIMYGVVILVALLLYREQGLRRT